MKKGAKIMAKDTRYERFGRTVKKGLYYYMNKEKSGTSRKGKGTVSDEALKSAKTAKPKKEKSS